ncbi:acyl-CoA thioesterase [Kineococcus sp. SYSU DK018]|uniref:acyl-CoA thioesterase n=1 Tax=Kineococcus sp. SYSU DK018 TaxID=3383139 RepID=UPI003D7EEB80
MLRRLDLHPAPDAGPDVFTTTHQPIPSGRAYGGELVAQALAAATRTVDPRRRPHSLHGYFLRPADVSRPTTWHVQRVRDGRGFTARSVRGEQGGKAVFEAMLSFHLPRAGVRHAASPPVGLRRPEELPSTEQALSASVQGQDVRDAHYWARERGFDVRHDPRPLYTTPDPERGTEQAVWFRAWERLPDDPAVHRTALAYFCDYTLLEPVLRHHGVHWTAPGLVTASVDHALWFHADGRLDEWNVLVQGSPAAGNGLGLGTANVFSASGELLATVAQQGVVLTGDEEAL